MKPHLAVAEKTGVSIGIENHAGNLIESPDLMKWPLELRPSSHLANAFASYHLRQDEQLLSGLICAPDNRIAIFYTWQLGKGSVKNLPKRQELLQMLGRGELDF